MKCQILFSGENIINLLSAEFDQREVKVKLWGSETFSISYDVTQENIQNGNCTMQRRTIFPYCVSSFLFQNSKPQIKCLMII